MMHTISIKPMLYSIALILLIISCQTKQDRRLDNVLYEAGENRRELENVVVHYQKTGDKRKEEAARFLIRNMLGKYYKEGETVNKFHQFIDSLYQTTQEYYDEETINKEYEEIQTFIKTTDLTQADLKQLNAIFLISHIDKAFQVWQKPWNKHLSFDDFCEWILPYRFGNELPERWRDEYYARYSPLLSDSVTTAREACTIINNELMKQPIRILKNFSKPGNIKPSSLIHIKFGLCEEYSQLAVYAMRSVGIPVTTAIIPHWGRWGSNHSLNLVYDNDGKYYDFSGAEENPGDHLKRFVGIPKVYQKTFSVQENAFGMKNIPIEDIPPFFRNLFLKDVTEHFPFIHPKTITVPLTKGDYKQAKYAYLCVFDPAGWFPVDWGKVNHKQVTFQHVGADIIYQIASYNDNILRPLSSPFFVDSIGTIHTNECHSNKINMALKRKYRDPVHLFFIPPTIVGSKFQGSNFPDFRQVDDLYVFTEIPEFNYTTVKVNPPKAYKYYRFLSSEKAHGNIAEIEFYEASKQEILKGLVIGTDETSIYNPHSTKDNVFDDDPLTFFHSRDTLSWVGLALPQPVRIDRIRYIIRNDDNGIRKGNHYELFYIDNKGQWASAGKKYAEQDDLLIYEQLPEGTLYWLHNYTRGKEERIFTYEDGKQIWW